MSFRSKSKRVDWAKYCNFKSRHSRSDLEKLCSRVPASKLSEIFSTQDSTGLCPIHWAAIHNRSDFIQFMANSSCPLRVKCRNGLFANGTPLHLAAMNGCIEAAAALLQRADNKRENQTRAKAFITLTVESPIEENPPDSADSESQVAAMLKDRDSEGQTPLMRTAAPRSKRLDIVRDLLRKNLWSLNGRPAEVALLLINKGADWRETDTFYGMNLFHLAIMNDYDDIVNMLLEVDRDLINVVARVEPTRRPTGEGNTSQSGATDLESIDLSRDQRSPSSWSIDTDDSSASSEPLVSMKERTERITSEGLKPLQLAIIYGRLNMIGLLHRAEMGERKSGSRQPGGHMDGSQVKGAMWRSLCSNRSELIKFMRVCLLRGLLVTDLSVLVLVWLPVYLTLLIPYTDIGLLLLVLRNGALIVVLLLTILFGYRVMSKDPGHLRRNQEAYRAEMRSLTVRAAQPGDSTKAREGNRRRERAAGERDDIESRVRLLCHKCKCMRRPRSRHCNQCNYCIQDFDHHCIYLGCCIGRRNRLDFLILMILIGLTGTYGTFIHQSSLTYYEKREFWHILGAIWVSKYIVIGGLAAFFIVRRACQGITMFEAIRSARIRNLFGAAGPPDEINRSHQTYSTLKGSFWRYTPDRFVTGDLPLSQMRANLAEFSQLGSPSDHLLGWLSSDSSLARSSWRGSRRGRKEEVYRAL